jgi:MFS family permease
MKISPLLTFWSLWFLNFSSRTIFSPLLPVIENQFGLSHAEAGTLVGLVPFGYTITLIVSGMLSPRLGYKYAVGCGYAIMAVSLFAMNYASAFAVVSLLAFLIGIGTGIYLPSSVPLITATFEPKNWGKALAIHGSAASVSLFAVPLIAAVMLRFFPWNAPFLLLGAGAVVAVVFFWNLTPNPRPRAVERLRLSHFLRRRDFWTMTLLFILVSSCALGMYSIIPLFLVTEKGIPLEKANTFFGISRIGGAFFTLVAGVIADRYGTKSILQFIILATGISTIGIALAQPFWLLFAFMVTQATIMPGFFSIGLTTISKLAATDQDRSAFTGFTVAIGSCFGVGLTPIFLGKTADIWNFQIGILVLGCLTVLSPILLQNIRGSERL